MFGWFSSKCPVGTWEKAWIETRMRWLADQFGLDRLLGAEVLLPTEDYFPEPYHGTDEDVRRLLDRLCGHMGLDAGKIDLEVCLDAQLPGGVGLYEPGGRTVIRVAESQLAEPQKVLGTLAHELSHELLLGSGLLTPDIPDHEWVTDLLPVFLGVGVFAANSVISESYGHDGQWSWWSIRSQGYLPARMFGYAFALFCFMRGEGERAWASHLRLDAASALKEGLRYLTKTGDSLFHPDTVRAPRIALTADEAVARLGPGPGGPRLAALWEVRERRLDRADVVAALVRCLHDRDPDIAAEAARALGDLGPASAPAVPRLLDALRGAAPATRAGAAEALGALGMEPGEVIPELAALLGKKDPALARSAS